MISKFHLCLGTIALLVSLCGCGSRGAADGERLNVAVYKVMDKAPVSVDGFLSADIYLYRIADTARVSRELEAQGLQYHWGYASDEYADLVVLDGEPVVEDTVTVTAVNYEEYADCYVAIFRFSDADKWERVTGENTGHRLALFVNGRFENAPTVNCPITSGNCSFFIDSVRLADDFPTFAARYF